MEEKVLGVFPIDIRGPAVFDFYDMYFTDRRIIANAVGHGLYPRARGKISTLFSFGGILDYGIVRPLTEQKDQAPLSDPEEILKANKSNFVWDYEEDVRTIEFKEKTGLWGPPAMVIKLAKGKDKFCVLRKEHLDSLRSLLRETASKKVVGK